MPTNYLEQVLNARVYDVAQETPVERAAILSERLGNHVWLKREDMQSVFSFKCRGAYNKMVRLTPAQLNKGVIASSAGNHAQGVALAARRLGVGALIVMPRTTPQIKIDAVRGLGASVVLHGDNYDSAYGQARRLAARKRLAFVHPYDDPEVIAGQGTIGAEILKQRGHRLDAIFVPVGGGGLIAGIAAYVKQVRPQIRIIGVEPEDADAMYRSLKCGRRVVLEHVGAFADGVAVRQVGAETLRLCRRYVDEIIRVSNDEICAAIKEVFEDRRSVLEPAGALATAGLKRYVARTRVRGKHLVAVASGANLNFHRLRYVSERADIGERREAMFVVTIPEQVNSLKRLCAIFGERNITELEYCYSGSRRAYVFVGAQIGDRRDEKRLADLLRRHGYCALDLSGNDAAKLHVRRLAGNGAASAADERLYRFELPERPGALKNFLDALDGRWNVSLMHYRFDGAHVSRVLVGMYVAPGDARAFRRFLVGLGYHYVEETANPAYRLLFA